MAIPRSFLGGINLSGSLQLASSAGTSGYMLVSQGAGNTPAWSNTLTSPTINVINASSSSTTTADVFGNITTGTASFADGVTSGTVNLGTAATTTTGRTVNINTNASGSITVTTNIGSPVIGSTINLAVGLPGVVFTSTGLITTSAVTGGNSSTMTLRTGNTTTSGNSGNLVLDVGTAAATAGTVSIGTSAASGVTISRSGITTTVGGTLNADGINTTNVITAGTNIYSGNVLALNGKSATIASQDSGYYFNPAGYGLFTRSGGFPFYIHRYGGSGTYGMVQFVYNGTNNGTINVASGGTPAFASGSDYRIKTDITPITDAIERMKNAKAYTFYKINEVDPSDTLHTGFLAHELAEVQPDAVLGEKDAVDEDGNPIYQEVMEAKIIPVMAQAINDLIKQNELLVARIEALENR